MKCLSLFCMCCWLALAGAVVGVNLDRVFASRRDANCQCRGCECGGECIGCPANCLEGCPCCARKAGK